MNEKEHSEEHGPQVACYSMGEGEPFIECICGWHVTGLDWETVGCCFDQHLHQFEVDDE